MRLKLIRAPPSLECSCGLHRAYPGGMEFVPCAGCQALQRRRHDLQAENDHLGGIRSSDCTAPPEKLASLSPLEETSPLALFRNCY